VTVDRRTVRAVVLDVLVVLVFAAVGRRSHGESSAAVGVLGTAWPFLTGIAVGWLVSLLALRVVPLTVRHGIPVWLSTVAVGMLLRVATGSGTAFSFIVVATVFLGVFLLGWRAVAGLLARRLVV
jgi:hypothetical protein